MFWSWLLEEPAFAKLTLFSDVKLGDGAVIPHHTSPDFTRLTFVIFELDVAVHGVDREIRERARLAARRSASQVGQNLCSPAMYPWVGQIEKVGVMVRYGMR